MRLYNKNDLKYSRIFFDKKPPIFLTIFIISVFLLIVGTIVIAAYLNKNYIVKGQGIIMDQHTKYISTKTAGVITKIEKNEGDIIKENDVLFIVSSGEEGLQIAALKTQLQENEAKLETLKKYKNSLNDKINYMQNSGSEQEYYGKVEYYLSQIKSENKQNQELNSDKKEKQAKYNDAMKQLALLENKKIALEKQLKEINQEQKIEIESKITEVNSEITSKKSEIEGLVNEIKQFDRQHGAGQSNQMYFQFVSEIGTAYSNIEKVISELKANIEVNEKRETNYTVVANNEGVLHYQMPLKTGMSVQQGQVIAEITTLEDKNYYVESYISTTEISKIKVGQAVDVALIGVNTQKYGTLKGIVKSIDTGTITQQTPQENQSFYKVEILLKNTSLKNKNEEIHIIQSQPVETRIIYDKETYLDWILEMLSFK